MADDNKNTRKTGRGCCVPGCKNRESDKEGLKFYVFPNRPWEVKRKVTWIKSVRRQGEKNVAWAPTTSTRICSAHFEGGEKSNDPRKLAFNPTIFPWSKPMSEAALARKFRWKKRSTMTSVATDGNSYSASAAEESFHKFMQEKACVEPVNELPKITVHKMEIKIDPDLDEVSEEESSVVPFYWQDSIKKEVSTQI